MFGMGVQKVKCRELTYKHVNMISMWLLMSVDLNHSVPSVSVNSNFTMKRYQSESTVLNISCWQVLTISLFGFLVIFKGNKRS